MRLSSFFLFFAGVLAVDAGAHWYLWARLLRDPAWPPALRLVGGGILVTFAIGLPLGMVLTRALPRGVASPIAGMLFVWMGLVFYLVVIFLVLDLLRALASAALLAFASIASELRTPDPVRRQLLVDGAAKVAGATAIGLSAMALRSGLGEVEVREVGVELARLPRALSGLTIVQLSDLHVGPTIGRRFMDAIVEKTNGVRPDVIVITGDLVDGTVRELEDHVAPLARLNARYGVYFVTGNHEYYSGAGEWIAHIEKLGIRVLRNERVILGENQASIDLAGVNDHSAARFSPSEGPDVARALSGRDPDREILLLAHQPKAIDAAARAGVGLQLSGHTHGGQLWPFSGIVALTQPYLAGLHRHGERSQIYVSRGTGYWGPPMRLFAPSEITKIVLGAA